MKKTIISALVLLFGAFTTIASAGVNVGVTGSTAALLVDGFEIQKESEKHTRGDDSTGVEIGSIFAEWDSGNGYVIGLDWVPVSAEMDKRTKAGKTDHAAGLDVATVQTADATFENLMTLYVESQVGDTPVFLKAGLRNVEVSTLESLGTGETYGDKDLSGAIVGIGVKHTFNDRLIVKAGTSFSRFETLKLTGTNGNKIEADINIVEAQVSLAVSF